MSLKACDIKVDPLKGVKALSALNAFSAVIIGYKMLPIHLTETFDEYFQNFRDMDDAKKEAILRKALFFVELDQGEVLSLISFVRDPNGVPYTRHNVNNLSIVDLHEALVAVCLEIGRIDIDIIGDSEKKK